MRLKKAYLCRCHPDFHIPGDAIVGEGFDGAVHAAKAKDAGADSLVFFGKCHYGFSYYPTRIGTVHPGLQKDMLGEFVKGCREAGLGATCYYSVFLDGAAVRKRPEWILRKDKGPLKEQDFSGKYLPVCVNSGYPDELLIPQSLEIIERYDVDELFYDTMSEFIPCYCGNCRSRFGKPIPENSADPGWLEYVQWYYGQYEAFFAKVARIIHERKPEVSVIFNWAWSAGQPDLPPPFIRRLAGDLFTSGSTASYYAHYWAGTGYPFDYMCGRFLHGLGDWSNNTPETLKYTGAAAIASGGGFYLIDRQLPDGSMEERAYAVMKDVFGFIQERRDVVEGAEHLPETAVLHPLEHIIGPELQYFPAAQTRKMRMRQLEGAAHIFMRHGRHYTALNTGNLLKMLPQYKLLVLPELEHLSAGIKTGIKSFVEAGGNLLIAQSGDTEKVDGDILEFAGADYEGHAALDYSYIEYNRGGIPDPILVRGRFALIKPKGGARVLKRLILPLPVGKEGREFGHGFAPPADSSGHAAVISRQVGKGKVIYAAGPLFTSYETFLNPNIAALVLELTDILLPEPICRVETPARVEMTAVKKGTDLIIHLVNHSGKETLVNGWLPVTEYIPKVYDIKLSIKAPPHECKIISAPDGNTMEAVAENGYLKFNVPFLEIMRSFRLNGYFNDVPKKS
ncbi:MAG: alpha-L-fucosidase [Bacillota bacterium]